MTFILMVLARQRYRDKSFRRAFVALRLEVEGVEEVKLSLHRLRMPFFSRGLSQPAIETGCHATGSKRFSP